MWINITRDSIYDACLIFFYRFFRTLAIGFLITGFFLKGLPMLLAFFSRYVCFRLALEKFDNFISLIYEFLKRRGIFKENGGFFLKIYYMMEQIFP